MARVRTFAHQRQIKHRLHAYLWLFGTYVIPAGMYASQIRATAYLQQGTEMDNCIQKSEILDPCWVYEHQLLPGVSSVSVESNLFNSTGSEPVHAFIILSPIGTALYFTRFIVRTSHSPQEFLLLDIPSVTMSAKNGLHHAHIFSKRYALLICWT
eukprot:1138435-Pelagomonas_calceolata.AAC.1